MHVVASAVTFLAQGVEEQARAAPRSAVAHMSADEIAGAAGEGQRSRGRERRVRRDVVDDAADRHRAIGDLARALQHLDGLESLDGGVIVGRVVAVGCVRQRQAILEEKNLARPGRIQAPDADIRAEGESLLVAHAQPGHLGQRLVQVEEATALERGPVEDVDRPGNPAQRLRALDQMVCDHGDLLAEGGNVLLRTCRLGSVLGGAVGVVGARDRACGQGSQQEEPRPHSEVENDIQFHL